MRILPFMIGLLSIAALLLGSCSDSDPYPVTLTLEAIEYGDLHVYESLNGDAIELDATEWEEEVVLEFSVEQLLTSITLLSESTAEFIFDDSTSVASTYSTSGDTFTFEFTLGSETTTLPVKGDLSELTVDARIFKISDEDGLFTFPVGSMCSVSNIDGAFCEEPDDLFDEEGADGLIAVIRDATLVFAASD